MDGILDNLRDIIIIATGVCEIVVLAVILYVLLKYVPAMARSVNQLTEKVAETAKTVEKELDHVKEVVTSVQAISTDVHKGYCEHLVPAMSSLNKMTAHVADSAAEISSVVHEGGRFSRETLYRGRYYRDALFRPVIEIISLWSGISAALHALPKGVVKFPAKKREW